MRLGPIVVRDSPHLDPRVDRGARNPQLICYARWAADGVDSCSDYVVCHMLALKALFVVGRWADTSLLYEVTVTGIHRGLVVSYS
jgi:hypothetical protein